MKQNDYLLSNIMKFVSTNFETFKYDYFYSMNIGINHHITINEYEFVFNFDKPFYIEIWGNGFNNDFNTIYSNKTIMDFINFYTDNINKTPWYEIEILGTKLIKINFPKIH